LESSDTYFSQDASTPGGRPRRHPTEYEYRVLTIAPSTSRSDARLLLTQEAEYGRWELARSRAYVGGERRVWLRRRIIRVRSTL